MGVDSVGVDLKAPNHIGVRNGPGGGYSSKFHLH